jgi:hypothetical protein
MGSSFHVPAFFVQAAILPITISRTPGEIFVAEILHRFHQPPDEAALTRTLSWQAAFFSLLRLIRLTCLTGPTRPTGPITKLV